MMMKVAYNYAITPLWLLILMVGGWTGIASSQASNIEDTQQERARLMQLLESMDDLVRVTRTLLHEIPRESFQAAPIVELANNDPETLRTWISENILLVPYAGVLRGRSGTMMDRSGNSLDRAILLATLLEHAGHKPLLQRTTLSEEQVRQHLLPQVLNQDLAHLREEVSPLDPAVVPEGLTGESYARVVEQLVAHEQRLESVLMRTEQQLPLLAGQLDRLGGGSAEETKWVELLRDHWWVRIGGESGMVLDPALQVVEGIHDQSEFSGTVADLPDELYHKVTARVVIEQWDEGKLNEKIPLEQTWRAADIATEVIVFSVSPTQWDTKLDVLNEEREVLDVQIKKELAAKKSWVPSVSVGGKEITQKSFNANGELENPNESSQTQALGRAVGLLGALGGEAKPEGELTAVWQEWVLERPDGVKRVQRRMLVDWIGAENRRNNRIPESRPNPGEEALLDRSLALMSRGTGMVLTGEVSRPYMLARAAVSIINSNEAYKKILLAELERDSARLEEGIAGVEVFPEDLFSWAVLRHELNAMRSRVFLDEPNLVLKQHRLSAAENGQGLVRTGMDLVFNRVAVLSDNVSETRTARLEQGVVDASLESVLMEKEEQVVYSTSNLYQQTDPRLWQQVTSIEELNRDYQELSDPVRELMRTALLEGHVVVIPPNWTEIPEDRLCWWELDESGHLLGRGAWGWGQSGTEYLINLYVAKAAITMLIIGHNTCTGPSLGCWICSAIGGALIAFSIFAAPGLAVAAAVGSSTGGAVVSLICAVAM